MFWSQRTGEHGVSVNEHEVTVWTGQGRHGSGASVSHFQFLDGSYNAHVLRDHDQDTLDRARTECLKYLHQDTFDAIRSARLSAWASIPVQPELVEVVAKPDACGERMPKGQDEWVLEFNPHDRVTIGKWETVWNSPRRRTTTLPGHRSPIIIHNDWLYAIRPGLHIFSKTGEAVLSTPPIAPALGSNPWGFDHCVSLSGLFRRGCTVVATYGIYQIDDPAIHRCISNHGIIALDPVIGISGRYATAQFSEVWQ